MNPDLDRMRKNWRVLCRDIGERLAGTAGESQAAHFIQGAFARAGCTSVHQESFFCRSRRSAVASVEIREKGRWRSVEAAAVTGASETDGVVEGEPVWLEMPEQVDLLKPGSLTGRILIMFGPLPDVLDHHIRLVRASPGAVIHIDHRLPFGWAKADGTFPLWVRRHGFPPVLTVPYTEAWGWRVSDSTTTLRVSLSTEMVDAESSNVVGELAGDGDGLVLIGAHHDTQAGNVGADDNASGVVALLELAHLLRPIDRRRTIRLVSFGTEEQLSVGSAAYAATHRPEMGFLDLVVNFDSISSPMGHHTLVSPGKTSLVEYGVDALRRHGLSVAVHRATIPFSDHFPFTVFGVPALWLYRENFPGGRWQHHSAHDNLTNVSAVVAAQQIGAVAGLAAEVATTAALPFERGLDPDLAGQTAVFARDLYGMESSD